MKAIETHLFSGNAVHLCHLSPLFPIDMSNHVNNNLTVSICSSTCFVLRWVRQASLNSHSPYQQLRPVPIPTVLKGWRRFPISVKPHKEVLGECANSAKQDILMSNGTHELLLAMPIRLR